MSRKAVFAVVSHLSSRGSSLLHVRADITHETYLFLVITIAADGKLAAVATATVDGGCGRRLQTTTTAPDEDNACSQWRGRQLALKQFINANNDGGGGQRLWMVAVDGGYRRQTTTTAPDEANACRQWRGR